MASPQAIKSAVKLAKVTRSHHEGPYNVYEFWGKEFQFTVNVTMHGSINFDRLMESVRVALENECQDGIHPATADNDFFLESDGLPDVCCNLCGGFLTDSDKSQSPERHLGHLICKECACLRASR